VIVSALIKCSNQVPWLRWYRPVFEGDSIMGHITIIGKELPKPSSDYGLVSCDIIINNQRNIKVMELNTNLMVEIGEQKND
jgi:acyl dehydratase